MIYFCEQDIQIHLMNNVNRNLRKIIFSLYNLDIVWRKLLKTGCSKSSHCTSISQTALLKNFGVYYV